MGVRWKNCLERMGGRVGYGTSLISGGEGREGRVSGSLPDAELSTGGSTEIWECQGAKFDQERTLQKQPALEFPMQLVTGKKKL